MTEPTYLRETRVSYDTVADNYAELVPPLLVGDPLMRSMLGAFAELVRAAGDGPVADVGCGPGHVTAHLDSLGLTAFGIDLSPAMVDIAQRTHPGLRFATGTMTALELADGELGGIVAWYSIIHIPPEALPTVFSEFHRVLAPGGHLLLGFHVGDEKRRKTKGYGDLDMALDVYWRPPARVAELATRAGLSVQATMLTEPDARVPQAFLLARKP
ncbi:class I SAM-dependent methyltransferase [Streptomyces sp. TS71-3]|uniref:class I SAM-dependent DNA methyltransferase n=1 Tax=Streptomyces sp. TS71-3 TaxID=2733862 RepID=UPI001B15F22D|nr:class I SAM-dependent methyltransferase [Streptomyces sp. TS71-3]GHJ39666.1 methyltransferase [Streptomyces sp. TS71-3]